MYGFVMTLLFLGAAALATWLGLQWVRERERLARGEAEMLVARKAAAEERERADGYKAAGATLQKRNRHLERFADVADVQAEVVRRRAEALAIVADAEREARSVRLAAQAEATAAGVEADEQARRARAMKNVIEGYGDEYLKPADGLLDDLAEDFGHEEAGRRLKAARQRSRQMAKDRQIAACDYAEPRRREAAEHFVADAFNGKVDAILSKLKRDNHGTLEAEVRDAFTLVNAGGEPFRNARITPGYLDARLEELRWGAVAHELRERERAEQREFKAFLREEAKVKRELERAHKEAEKEKRLLAKAMAEARAAFESAAAAGEAERAAAEAKLAEVQAQLDAAEAKDQRALSMAQQTRRGHVYVISNVGSFGEQVFKIGLTRRLEPMDRVKELGDASVPFEFDVHALIWADDAPALEAELHRRFDAERVNKVNPRKEFFRATLAEIRRQVEAIDAADDAAGGEIRMKEKWTMKAAAAEYRETRAIERAASGAGELVAAE